MNNQRFPLYYETYGTFQDPALILVTGIGAQLIQWPKSLIDFLVAKKFYVVIFDNRDSGLSQQYDHLGTPGLMAFLQAKLSNKNANNFYSLEDMATDVLLLMDHLSIQKAHILGISMGGMIAQLFALQYPERVLSLILMGTTSQDKQLPPAKPEVLQFFLKTLFQRKTNLQAFVDSKIKLFLLYNPYFFNEEKIRALLAAIYQRARTPNGFKRQLIATISAKPRGERLKQLQVKSLILHGNVDPVFPPEHAKYLATCIPHSQLAIIEQMGHFIPDELCEKISSIISHFVTDTR
jgi:pimeloyl-ACP methyl ester carboxylesterase